MEPTDFYASALATFSISKEIIFHENQIKNMSTSWKSANILVLHKGSHRIFKTCHELFLCLYVCTDSGKSNVTCVTDLNGTYVILPLHPCEANEYKSKLFQSKKGLRNGKEG